MKLSRAQVTLLLLLERPAYKTHREILRSLPTGGCGLTAPKAVLHEKGLIEEGPSESYPTKVDGEAFWDTYERWWGQRRWRLTEAGEREKRARV